MAGMPQRFALLLATSLAACGNDKPCLRYESQQVATYPYAGMQGINSAFMGLAYTPVYVAQRVCVERAK